MAAWSSFLLRGDFNHNLELVHPWPDGGFAHWWGEGNPPNVTWHGPNRFGEGIALGCSVLQSDYCADGNTDHGDLELLATMADGTVHAWWRDNGPPFVWHDLRLITRMTDHRAPPTLLQVGGYKLDGPDRDHSDFRMLVPATHSGVRHFTRKNSLYDRGDSPPWWQFDVNAVPPLQDLPIVAASGVAHLVSTCGSDPSWDLHYPGEETAVVADRNGRLSWWVLATVPDDPSDPTSLLHLEWQQRADFPSWGRGRGCLFQSDYELDLPSIVDHTFHYGNYELFWPRYAGGIDTWWLDNGGGEFMGRDGNTWRGTDRTWQGPWTFGTALYTEVAALQGEVDGDDGHNVFELAARAQDWPGFHYYWRSGGPGFTWHGPVAVGVP